MYDFTTDFTTEPWNFGNAFKDLYYFFKINRVTVPGITELYQ